MSASTTVEQIISGRELRLEFQPIVELSSNDVTGFEALMRGPEGPLGSPEALLAAAKAEGIPEDLDRLARFTALFHVARDGMRPGQRLFVNTEGGFDTNRFGIELEILDEMAPGVQNVLEVTERATQQDHDALAEACEVARGCGWLVALDDLGAPGTSSDMLETLRPEFVKLDQKIVQQPPTVDDPSGLVAAILGSLERYVTDTGALLIAEGIENPLHLESARTLGADWGQGWFLGMPGPLPANQL